MPELAAPNKPCSLQIDLQVDLLLMTVIAGYRKYRQLPTETILEIRKKLVLIYLV